MDALVDGDMSPLEKSGTLQRSTIWVTMVARLSGFESHGCIHGCRKLFCHNRSVISEEEDMAELSIQCIDCGAPLIPEVEESCCRCVWCDSLFIRKQFPAGEVNGGLGTTLELAPKVTAGEFIRPNVKFIG